MASCSIATDSAHFSLCGLESNSSGVLSSISFQPASSSVTPVSGSLPVTDLCAQVICLTGQSDMHSTRKNGKNDNSKRAGKKVDDPPGPAAKKITVEAGSFSGIGMKSKIVTRRSAEKHEPAAAFLDSKLEGNREEGAAKLKRRGLKRAHSQQDIMELPGEKESVQENHEKLKTTGEPEKRRRLRSNSLQDVPLKVPGTAFKICASCGTVADKTKAKKCRQCKKFFFNHWAKRCRIPPCPKCHFSRKAKSKELIPSVCEKCGSQLPVNFVDDGNDSSKADSSSTDLEESVSLKACKDNYNSVDAVQRDVRSDNFSLPNAVSTPLVSPDELGSFRVPDEQSSSFMDRSSLGPSAGNTLDNNVKAEEPLEVKAVSVALDSNQKVKENSGSTEGPGHMSVDFTDFECSKECVKGSFGGTPGEAAQEGGIVTMKLPEEKINEVPEKAVKDSPEVRMVGEEIAAGIGKVMVKKQEMSPQKHGITACKQEGTVRELSEGGLKELKELGGWEVSTVKRMSTGEEISMCVKEERLQAGGKDVAAREQEVAKQEMLAGSDREQGLRFVPSKWSGGTIDLTGNGPPPAKVGQCESEASTVTSCSQVTGLPVSSGCAVGSTVLHSTYGLGTISCPHSSIATSLSSSFNQKPPLSTELNSNAEGAPAMPTSSSCPVAAVNTSCSSRLDSDRLNRSTCATNMIDKSLKEHFERSLAEARQTSSSSSPSLSNRNSSRECVVVDGSRVKEEEKVEVATVVKVDRFSQGDWSEGLGSAAASKPLDPAMFGTGFKPRPKSPSDAGQATLPGHMFSNSQPILIPSFLGSQTSSALPISVPSPLPLSVMSPMVFPLLPTSTLTSSHMLFQQPIASPLSISPPATSLTRFPFASTALPSTCQHFDAATMQFISSIHANSTGTKPSKLPVITSIHPERACKMNVSPPSTVQLPSSSALPGATPTSRDSQSGVDGLPEVYIVEKNSTKAAGSTNLLGNTGLESNSLPLVSQSSIGLGTGLAIREQAEGTDQNMTNSLLENLAKLDNQESEMPAMPKLASKTAAAAAVGPPPSLVSIGVSGTVTISRSYTLPQAPRVSITVAPPPLQNIKDMLVTKSSPLPLQVPVTGIAPLKKEIGSKPFPPNVGESGIVPAGKGASIPPLVCTNSLGSPRVDGMTVGAERLTASSTVAINIMSAAKPSLVDHQTGAASLTLSEQRSLPIPSSGLASAELDRMRSSSIAMSRGTSEHHLQKSTDSVSLLPKIDGGGGGHVEVPSQSSTSFQKLDLLHSPPLSANKIRVTLLKGNSDSGADHTPPVSSPTRLSPLFPPSNTRLITKVYEFPRRMSDALNNPVVPSTSSAMPTSSSSVSVPRCSPPMSLPVSTVTPSSVSNSCRVTSPVSLGNFRATPVSIATVPNPTTVLEVPTSKAQRSVSPQFAAPVANTSAMKQLNVSLDPRPSMSDKMPGDIGTSVAPSSTAMQETISTSACQCTSGEEEGSARTKGLGGFKRRDLSALAMEKLQRRISAFANKSSLLETDYHHQAKASTTLPAPPPSQMAGPSKMNSYRRILPNISKYPQNSPQVTAPLANPLSNGTIVTTTTSTISSAPPTSTNVEASQPAPSLSSSSVRSSSPSYSHVRTPGVVTVQVCSSIPATLSLSSIITPKITQAEAVGGESSGPVSSPTDGSFGLLPTSASSARSSLVKHRSGIVGGGGVMVTPLSPSILPPGRTVAQIVTNSISSKENSMSNETKKMAGSKVPLQAQNRDTRKEDSNEEGGHHSVLYSEERLNSSSESGEHQQLEQSMQTVEAAGDSNNKTNKSSDNKSASNDNKDDGNESEEEDEEEEEGEEDQDGESRDGKDDENSKDNKGKKRMKPKNDNVLYTVKLRDCYMHHMMWEEHRVVLIVPTHQKSDSGRKSKVVGDGGGSASSGKAESSNTASISERRRRRKPKHEILQDTEEDMDDVSGVVESSGSTCSSHIRSPCFSMYELRLKHFRHMTSNAVYAYTYKHQIKSLRTPTHWVQVLRRMGGVQEHGHTFRLIDILRVKEMCQQFNVLSSWPSNLEALARNEIPKNRMLIDLSHFTPEELMDTRQLEVIPACPCAKPPTPPPVAHKAKRTYTKRKHLLKEERKKRKYTRRDSLHLSKKPKTEEPGTADVEDSEVSQSVEESLVSNEDQPTQKSQSLSLPLPEDNPRYDRPPVRRAVVMRWPNGKGAMSRDEEDKDDEEEEEEEELSPPSSKKLALPHSRQAEMPSPTTRAKKKVCPDCCTPIARKCKKCPSCGKSFGVFTFGRRVCPMCGRTNKARMLECFQCGQSLSNAPKALPKVYNALSDSYIEHSKPYSRTGSVFGARKRRNLHSLPGYPSTMTNQHHVAKIKDQSVLQPKITMNQSSPRMMEKLASERRQGELGRKFYEDSSREIMKSNGDDLEDPMGAAMDIDRENASAPLLLAGKTEKEFEGRARAKSKQSSSYQYGRVAWGEADITCLVDEKGLVKVCLQELCSKVLHNHGKSNVFDVVKSLNLPIEHGDLTLLRKLQALGLHTNRSPMCRLIASEELWTLLDALEEAVPEEVYHHLDQLSTCNTPLLSPHAEAETSGKGADGKGADGETSAGTRGSAGAEIGEELGAMETSAEGDSAQKGGESSLPPATSTHVTPASVGTRSPRHSAAPSGSGAMVEEDERGFESTLHEVECSDGQSVSILRAFNGEQFACVTEFWRKYFPEVNRNHLTSALKRLNLDTILPTGQQATLLRSAGVISLRGAAGRLMKFESMEKLLDDFGIPLQIGKPTDKIYFSSKPTHPPNTTSHGQVGRPRLSVRRPTMRGYNAVASQGSVSQTSVPMLPPDKVLVTKEDAMYANFMRNILGSIDVGDLQTLLVDVQQKTLNSSSGLGSESSGVESEISAIQQLIYSRRLLCSVLADEISYLTTSNHGYMAETVRLERVEKQFLKDIQDLLNTYDISLPNEE